MRAKPFVRDERGQALTEMALVLPVLVILVLAIAQLGMTLNRYLTLTDAVRAGMRQATVSRTADDPVGATAHAVRAAASDLDGVEVQVSSTWQAGAPVTVTARYPYSLDILGLVVRSGKLTSSTTGRIE